MIYRIYFCKSTQHSRLDSTGFGQWFHDNFNSFGSQLFGSLQMFVSFLNLFKIKNFVLNII